MKTLTQEIEFIGLKPELTDIVGRLDAGHLVAIETKERLIIGIVVDRGKRA